MHNQIHGRLQPGSFFIFARRTTLSATRRTSSGSRPATLATWRSWSSAMTTGGPARTGTCSKCVGVFISRVTLGALTSPLFLPCCLHRTSPAEHTFTASLPCAYQPLHTSPPPPPSFPDRGAQCCHRQDLLLRVQRMAQEGGQRHLGTEEGAAGWQCRLSRWGGRGGR